MGQKKRRMNKEPKVKAKKISYSAQKEKNKIKGEIAQTVILWLYGSEYSDAKEIEDVSVRDVNMLVDFTAEVILNTRQNRRREERRRKKKEGKK